MSGSEQARNLKHVQQVDDGDADKPLDEIKHAWRRTISLTFCQEIEILMRQPIVCAALLAMTGVFGCSKPPAEVEHVEARDAELDSNETEFHSPNQTFGSRIDQYIEFPGLSELGGEDSDFLSDSLEKALKKLNYDLVSTSTESIVADLRNPPMGPVVRSSPNFEGHFGVTRIDVGADVRFVLTLPSTVQIFTDPLDFQKDSEVPSTSPDQVLTGNAIEVPSFVELETPDLDQIQRIKSLILTREQDELVNELLAYIQEQTDSVSLGTLLGP